MRATGMKSPTENESCSTCGRSEFRFGSPNSMTWPSAALLSTYSAPTTPPPPVRITEIIGWPKWGSAAVVMMLAWSTCEPPNGYGVTNCSSLSGNALATLVSAKAAAAVVASEVIDRRVVMISLFATTFLRSPRHRRRLAFGNRHVPSLEVGDVLAQPGPSLSILTEPHDELVPFHSIIGRRSRNGEVSMRSLDRDEPLIKIARVTLP